MYRKKRKKKIKKKSLSQNQFYRMPVNLSEAYKYTFIKTYTHAPFEF